MEKVERSPLKRLQSPTCKGSAVKALLNQTVNHSISESCLLSSGTEHSQALQGRDCTVPNGAPSEDAGVHRDSECERCEKRKERRGDEARDEEETERKLYKIASELLQTERTYVARLHLLDQVSLHLS